MTFSAVADNDDDDDGDDDDAWCSATLSFLHHSPSSSVKQARFDFLSLSASACLAPAFLPDSPAFYPKQAIVSSAWPSLSLSLSRSPSTKNSIVEPSASPSPSTKAAPFAFPAPSPFASASLFLGVRGCEAC